jgi:hypothetical protein
MLFKVWHFTDDAVDLSSIALEKITDLVFGNRVDRLHILEQKFSLLTWYRFQTLLFVKLIHECLNLRRESSYMVTRGQLFLAFLDCQDKLVVDIQNLWDQIFVTSSSVVEDLSECDQREWRACLVDVDSAVRAEGLAALEGRLAGEVETDPGYFVAWCTEDLGVVNSKLIKHGFKLGIIEFWLLHLHPLSLMKNTW